MLDGAGALDDVSVLAGLLVHRLRPEAVTNLYRLLEVGAFRHATTLWGKSLVDESAPQFLGIYAGAASDAAVQSAIEDAAVLVVAGVQFTDLNSGFFTQQIPRARTVELGATVASVGAATLAPLGMAAALERLTLLASARRPLVARATAAPSSSRAEHLARVRAHHGGRSSDTPLSWDTPLSQLALWDAVASHLRAGDIVLADQGTAFYGMATHRLPGDVTFLGQPLWASIGYTLPAALGACMAQHGSRGVLLIGDGAAHMTVQELSTMLDAELPLLVVVVDNDGYTVERAIHGPNEPYNDIPRWDWTQLPAFFAPGRDGIHASKAETLGDLETALQYADTHPAAITLVQARVPRMDVPELLSALTRSLSRSNAQHA